MGLGSGGGWCDMACGTGATTLTVSCTARAGPGRGPGLQHVLVQPGLVLRQAVSGDLLRRILQHDQALLLMP